MKGVPLDNYYHFKSCVTCTFCPGMDSSILYLYDKLGVRYANEPGQASCSGFCYHSGTLPWETNVALNARNLALAERSGKEVVCVCPTTYGNLKECREHLAKHPVELAKVNGILQGIGRSYGGGARVFHASEVVHAHMQRLRGLAKFGLDGMRIATHHGCHYSKIFYREVLGDSFERPLVLDDIVSAFGGVPVDYTERSLCCGMGFHHTLLDREYTKAIALRKLLSIIESGAELLLTQCPGCQMTLDYCQPSLAASSGIERPIPVMTYAQMVALLLGADPDKVAGVRAHAVPLEPVLRKMGVGHRGESP